ncbi:hypothetical protein D3C81_1916760 [compost metagenome]
MDQGSDTGLAGTGRANQRHGLIRLDMQVQIMQHRLPRTVTESHVIEFNRRRHIGQSLPIRFITQGHFDIQHFKDPVPGSHRTLHHRVLHGQSSDRIKETLHAKNEGNHDAHIELT